MRMWRNAAVNLGLVQIRGLGDIVIAMPIARYFYERGDRIHWPILEAFVPSFHESVPWVNWLGVVPDAVGDCYYKTPMSLLQGRTDRTICLYHYLASEPTLPDPALSSILKFDQYKFAIAKVPFVEKWNLSSCLVRNHVRETALFNQLVRSERYAVVHRRAGNESRDFDMTPAISKGYQIVEIDETTDCIFDWLTILERASILVLIDSVFANLVDQLGIGTAVPKIFLRRSHGQIAWTPVLMGGWQYL
jgi:hypothetical protein